MGNEQNMEMKEQQLYKVRESINCSTSLCTLERKYRRIFSGSALGDQAPKLLFLRTLGDISNNCKMAKRHDRL